MSTQHFLRVPYLAKLDNVIQPGQSLVIRGVAVGQKFDVNLTSGPQVQNYNGDDIGLHFSWRQKEKAIVLNSFENSGWKKEERHGGATIQEGQPFDLRIRAHDDRFEIFLEHKKVADFHHRVPLSILSHVFINGDVRLQALAWEGNYYSMPYRGGFPGNFVVGKKLFVTGLVEKDAKKFEINLYSGNSIALHFNPRLSDKVVVRNSRIGEAWGEEEREGSQPFSKNKQFDMVIHSEGDALQIYVNGEHHSAFRNRISPDKIDGLGVSGDLQLQSIAFD